MRNILLFVLFCLTMFSYAGGLGIVYDAPNEFELSPGMSCNYGIRISNFHDFDVNIEIVISDPNGLTEVKTGSLKYTLAPKEKVSPVFNITAPETSIPGDENTITFSINVVPSELKGEGGNIKTTAGGVVKVKYAISETPDIPEAFLPTPEEPEVNVTTPAVQQEETAIDSTLLLVIAGLIILLIIAGALIFLRKKHK